jgi:hypothetical protein
LNVGDRKGIDHQFVLEKHLLQKEEEAGEGGGDARLNNSRYKEIQ